MQDYTVIYVRQFQVGSHRQTITDVVHVELPAGVTPNAQALANACDAIEDCGQIVFALHGKPVHVEGL